MPPRRLGSVVWIARTRGFLMERPDASTAGEPEPTRSGRSPNWAHATPVNSSRASNGTTRALTPSRSEARRRRRADASQGQEDRAERRSRRKCTAGLASGVQPHAGLRQGDQPNAGHAREEPFGGGRDGRLPVFLRTGLRAPNDQLHRLLESGPHQVGGPCAEAGPQAPLRHRASAGRGASATPGSVAAATSSSRVPPTWWTSTRAVVDGSSSTCPCAVSRRRSKW